MPKARADDTIIRFEGSHFMAFDLSTAVASDSTWAARPSLPGQSMGLCKAEIYTARSWGHVSAF
jgi:hypothetical protein